MSKQSVAFIGLGVMGYPMAGHLVTAGYQTRVYNRTVAKAEKWCQDYQGDFASSPMKATCCLLIKCTPVNYCRGDFIQA